MPVFDSIITALFLMSVVFIVLLGLFLGIKLFTHVVGRLEKDKKR